MQQRLEVTTTKKYSKIIGSIHVKFQKKFSSNNNMLNYFKMIIIEKYLLLATCNIKVYKMSNRSIYYI